MAKHYSETTLKEIGEQCGNRLPPASAVQAMFLYEMQRESELERLFQGHLFKLARLDDSSKTLQAQLSHLSIGLNNLRGNVDAQISAVRKEITVKEVSQLEGMYCFCHWLTCRREFKVEERISTSQVRMDTFQSKLSQCNGRIDDQAAQSKTAQDKINEVSESMTAEQDDIKSKIASLDEDVALLFEERDALFETASTGTERIEGLENALTNLFKAVRSSNDAFATTKRMLETHSDIGSLKQEHTQQIEKIKNGHNEMAAELTKEQREHVKRLEIEQNEQNERIEELEKELKQERNDRIEHTEKLKNDHNEVVVALAKEQRQYVKKLRTEHTEHIQKLEREMKEHIEHISSLKNEQNDRIDKLETLVRLLAQNDRIDKLEDLVRVLTAQSPTTSSPASQTLSVYSTSGQSLDLVVQKGSSFIPYKKDNIRNFTPGTQWMA